MKNYAKFLIVTAAIASFAFISPKNEPRQINIVIDAGHGGKDFGATHENITEKEIVRQITNKIKALNGNKNVNIHITRTSDEFMELSQRTDFINKIKPDLTLSLHVNGFKNGNKSGVEIYVAKENNGKSTEFAQKLSEKFVKNHNFKVSEIKKAPYFILKNSEVPALIVELGFISNANDRIYLTDDNEQNRIASTILEFIAEME